MSSKNSITRIGIHNGGHLDEFVAIYLARRFGQQEWPDIHSATIVTKDGGSKLYNYKDMLYIGINEGQFDEHGPNKDDEICSADLIARFLGIETQYKVSFLLDRVRTTDRKGKPTTLGLGVCIQMLNHIGWSASRIESWIKVFLDCYHDDRTVIKNKNHVTPDDKIEFPVSLSTTRALISEDILFNQWLKKAKKGKTKEQLENELSKLRKDLSNLSKRQPSRMFDLIECACLIATYHPDDLQIVKNWVEPIFRASMKFQADFLSACEIIKPLKTIVIKPYDNCKPYDIIQVLGVNRQHNKNANRRLASAANIMNPHLDILVLQNPSGNVQIMIRRIQRYNLLPMIARAIRLEEMIVSGIDIGDINFDYEHLASTCRIDESNLWYMPVNDKGEGYALFNGSLTISNIKPTLIFFDRIIDIISKMVLTEDSENAWNRYANNRISLYRTEKQKKCTGNKLGEIARIK